MTETISPTAVSQPLPLPPGGELYAGLSTDHYPWTEVAADLAVRLSQPFSGVLDAVQGPRWARFVWVAGTAQGGHTQGGQAVTWATTTAALPRARVGLSALDPAVAHLVWATRASVAQAHHLAWPTLGAVLERDLYSGVLASGNAVSYWHAGRKVQGTLPTHGAQGLLYAPYTEITREALVRFWQDLLSSLHHHTPIETAWREVCGRLGTTYGCLDPFVQEVALRAGGLHVDPAVPATELRPALLAALRATLARLGLRLGDVPLVDMRTRPEWTAAGLEAL